MSPLSNQRIMANACMMKHGCELIDTGLTAKQGCSYFKSQGSGKSQRDPQL